MDVKNEGQINEKPGQVYTHLPISMIKRKTLLKPQRLNLASGGLKSTGLSKKTRIKSKGGGIGRKLTPEEQEADWVFYNKIWDTRPHVCQVCDRRLPNELSKMYMDHAIEKSAHPELRHIEENIIVVCVQCHHLKSNGFPHPRHQVLIEQAKKKLL